MALFSCLINLFRYLEFNLHVLFGHTNATYRTSMSSCFGVSCTLSTLKEIDQVAGVNFFLIT